MPEGDGDEAEASPFAVDLTRQIRQRLEALQRSGVESIPSPPAKGIVVAEKAVTATRPSPEVSVASKVEAFSPQVPFQPSNPGHPEPAAVKQPPAPKPAAKAPSIPNPITAPALFGDAGFDSPPLPANDRPGILLELAKVVSTCPKCPILVATRTQTVFGDGSPTARLMFIGEAPGAEEDRQGVPFVGRSGQLLTDMITKGMGLRREDVYIANILKCRPPENRNPEPDECANCLPYLERQIEIVRPEFLCLLGRVAALNLLQTTLALGKLRGRWHSVRGIKALVTYHPSYLLRNPPAKKDAWEDLQMIMNEMGLAVPARKKEGS